MKRYKTDKNFTNKLPKILIDDNNSAKNIHLVSEEERKIRNITLSQYAKYIDNYTKSLKYPSSNYYSTDKLKNFISFDNLNNINLNRKINFHSTFNEFNLFKKTGIFKTKINNNNEFFNNNIKLLSHSNYDSQDLIYFTPRFYRQKSDEDIFNYFVEGIFLRKPEYLKYIGINEKNIHPHILNQDDFDFYSNYLENISKNENLTEQKTKNYGTSDLIKNSKLNFNLDLKSICLQFDEININDEEKLAETKKFENEIFETNNEFNEINQYINNRHKLYLPFKYLPMIYLLNYSNLSHSFLKFYLLIYKKISLNLLVKKNLKKSLKNIAETAKINYLVIKKKIILKVLKTVFCMKMNIFIIISIFGLFILLIK